jgi:hypothetical protein
MLAGTNYDHAQFRKDVELILSTRGTRKPWGFFTIRAYEDEVIILEDYRGHHMMVDVGLRRRGTEPDEVRLADVDFTTPELRAHVLSLVVQIEDRK